MEQEPVVTRSGRTLIFEPVLSWSAILAGAAVALATSALLTLLAAGFGYDLSVGGFASRSSIEAFSPELGAATIAIQVISAGLGGYLAGRLRHAWTGAHLDEAHFRDTAQGLIAWAVATVAGLILAITVVTPYTERLALIAVATSAVDIAPLDPVRAAHL